MELESLTFIVTDDCNFNCSYCLQEKSKTKINNDTIGRAVDFFYPFLKENRQNYICFYGGEPLLASDQIKTAVILINEKNKKDNKKIKFSITTNGSLITPEILDFFDTHSFSVTLSLDGLAQDIGRKKGTLEKMMAFIGQLKARPGIDVEINSVFSPLTIADFSNSMRFLIRQNSPDITFNFSTMEEWQASQLEILKKELGELTEFLIQHYRETGTVPVKNFRYSPGDNNTVYRCSAGREQMTITPDGHVWGCYLFHDYFKSRLDHSQYSDYSFGTLDRFMEDYQNRYHEVSANYGQLRQDFFKVEENHCFLCTELGQCMVCPVNAAYTTGKLGDISCRQCRLTKIERNAVKRAAQQFNYIVATEEPG